MKVLRIPESPHTALETAVWTIYAPDSLPSRRQVGSGCAAWLHLPLGSQPSVPIVFSSQPFPESGSDGTSLVLVLHVPSWRLLILPIPFFVNRPFINLSSVFFFFHMCTWWADSKVASPTPLPGVHACVQCPPLKNVAKVLGHQSRGCVMLYMTLPADKCILESLLDGGSGHVGKVIM